MYYLKLLRHYAMYAVLLVAMIAGSIYQTNHGCTPHTGTDPGFEDVNPHDRVVYSYRRATPDAYEYGEMIAYVPRVRRADDARDQIVVGLVAGKPGDVVEIRDGRLIRNARETALLPEQEDVPDIGPLTVPRETLWVVAGSARADDSRSFGPIPIVAVQGATVFARR